MSASDTSSYPNPLDLCDGVFKGQHEKCKPSKKPANGNTFFRPRALIFIVFLFQISILLSLYLGATYAGSFSFLPPRSACHSTINTINTTTIATEAATHIVNRVGPPAGLPVSSGLWKQLARKQFYFERFQGCLAECAGCGDPRVVGRWETACRQTDRFYFGGVDCSAANLLEAAGGRLGDEVPIPEVCLEELARVLQHIRADSMEAEEKEGE
ncbi:hypothetical protein B0T18DRAFT_428482 [Schizothecium vesticola]|uniref:Uncharacterized protein n=1 Tax=Schizothecium vesticola TaxID=314040 RepID=A0AA40F3H9_9PEZI|nr:hypothetical protein B0T18DRAFT_428482 [Schizothecium vesticola]